MVRLLVRHGAQKHGAAKVVHVGANAHGATGAGKTAVGRNQQSSRKGLAAGQPHMRAFSVGVGMGHTLAGQQGDVAIFVLCGAQFGKGGASDQVVGHQPAQFGVAREAVLDAHGVGRQAVEHLGVAQGRERRGFIAFDASPQAQHTHLVGGALRQCDFAAVVGRVFQCGQRLWVRDADGQPAARERTRQAEPCGAGAADENVVVHGTQP